ncbi:MAG: hypothetical protein JWO52_1000 [Gammaproteobacteria bacterium]|jgi:hypothetical protein|nr:hypothetical protein [Gammaproteobacteria bacterium]
MSTSLVPRLPRMTPGTARAVPALAACLLASSAWAAEAGSASVAGSASANAAAGESQPAVWTEKELTFVYQGFTTRYSCDGLRDKVRSVLLDLGARKKDLKVQQLGCSSPTGRPDPFPGVRVKMSVLRPASGTADDQAVAAHWKPVDLKLRDSFTTDSGECELVEQIRHKIVPLFATRNVDLKTTCIPHQATAARPSLRLEVLAPDDAQHPAEEPQAAR